MEACAPTMPAYCMRLDPPGLLRSSLASSGTSSRGMLPASTRQSALENLFVHAVRQAAAQLTSQTWIFAIWQICPSWMPCSPHVPTCFAFRPAILSTTPVSLAFLGPCFAPSVCLCRTCNNMVLLLLHEIRMTAGSCTCVVLMCRSGLMLPTPRTYLSCCRFAPSALLIFSVTIQDCHPLPSPMAT